MSSLHAWLNHIVVDPAVALAAGQMGGGHVGAWNNTAEPMFSWLLHNLAALSGIGAAITFIWSIVQFILVRRRDQRLQEFEAHHRLIKELVQPDSESQVAWIDRQVAVVFELGSFRRYYPVTLSILANLRNKFTSDPKFHSPYLVHEMDLTIKHIGAKGGNPGGLDGY